MQKRLREGVRTRGCGVIMCDEKLLPVREGESLVPLTGVVSMSYRVVTRWGGSLDRPDERQMREVLKELKKPDPEHPYAWLIHESGWSLSVSESGLIIWENLEAPGEPRHQADVSREEALSLWLKLSCGEIAAIEQEPWSPGQSPRHSEQELAALTGTARQAVLAESRHYHESPADEMCFRSAAGTFHRVHRGL